MRPSSSIGPPLPPLTHPSFFSFSLSHGDFSSLFPRETTELEGRIGHVVSRSTAESKIKESCWLGTGETVHVRPCQFLLEGVYVLSRPCIFFSPPPIFLKIEDAESCALLIFHTVWRMIKQKCKSNVKVSRGINSSNFTKVCMYKLFIKE